MTFQQSKEFFKKLIETCKNIDNSVNEIKKKLNKAHSNDEYPAAKCITNIQERIQKLQTESNELKFQLEPNPSHSTKFYIEHFRELIVDTEVSVTNLENHLQKYGYTPSNLSVSSPAPEKRDCSPAKIECIPNNEDLSRTPNLLDYGIASHECSTSRSNFKERKSSFEDLVVPPMVQLKNLTKVNGSSGSTPTLEIEEIHPTKEETPPLPESARSVPQFPSTQKETPPLPESARSVPQFPSTQKFHFLNQKEKV